MTLSQKLFGMRWEKHFLKGREEPTHVFSELKSNISSNKCNSVLKCHCASFLPLLYKVDVLLWKNRHYFIQELIWIH